MNTLQAGNALDHPAVKEHGPFDVIHVGAAASDLPQVCMIIMAGFICCNQVSEVQAKFK